MFPTRKRIIHLHLGGKVIHTTAEHPFYVESKGWVNAGDMPGAKVEGEHNNPGEPTMPHYPFVGFVAGTPILTAFAHEAVEGCLISSVAP